MKRILLIGLIGLLCISAVFAATCNVAGLAKSCMGGAITTDTYNGCRTIKCTNGTSSMQVMACDKPSSSSPLYYEVYKQTTVGSSIKQVCIGSACVGSAGYAKSSTYQCGAQNTSTNTSTPVQNTTPAQNTSTVCTTALASTLTCTSTITTDVKAGCRSIICGASGNSITVLACDKTGYFEMYRQASSGTPPKVCLGSTCIQNEGFVKSGCSSTPNSTPTPTPTPPTPSPYPLKTNIISTIFWAGQGPSADTGWSNNYDSAWDVWWQEHYGGFDDPNNRNGYYPAGFTPKENPFYVAIPYTDFGNAGRKSNAFSVVPWSNEKPSWGYQESMIKNRWVRIIKGSKTAYAQVENAGPGPTDDWQYVFGSNAQPTTDFGHKAGIDVSPAVRDYLTLGPVDVVSWQWVPASQVPAGPWKNIVTTRQSCWASTICP